MSGLSSLLNFYSEVTYSLATCQAEHVSGLLSLLNFYSGMADALKEVLANRDAAVAHLSRTSAAADSARAAHRKFVASHESQQAR